MTALWTALLWQKCINILLIIKCLQDIILKIYEGRVSVVITIIAQGCGILAMIVKIVSFQWKSNKSLNIAVGIASLLFALNYGLIGALASAGFNLINIFRAVAITNEKTHTNIFFGLTCALYAIITVFTFDGWWTLVLLFSQIMMTHSLWYGNGVYIRGVQFLIGSPIWLINNSVVSFTIGGIACEVFTLVSIIISFIRYGKDGFEK